MSSGLYFLLNCMEVTIISYLAYAHVSHRHAGEEMHAEGCTQKEEHGSMHMEGYTWMNEHIGKGIEDHTS